MAAPQGWSRWYDDAPEHPKFLEAGHRAGWLYVCGQAYASRQATDGRIPKSVVPRLTDVPQPMKVAQRLVEVGLWHDRGDRFEQHDYTEMQATAEEREAKRREANERKRRERERRAADKARREAIGAGAPPPEDDGSHATVTRDTPRDVTRDNPVTSRDRHSDVLAGARAKPEPEPEAEVETEEDQDQEQHPPVVPPQGGTRQKRATQLPDSWQPNDTHHQIANDQGADCDHQAVLFRDHAKGNGRTQKDWDAAFRNWLRRSNDYGNNRPHHPASTTRTLNRDADYTDGWTGKIAGGNP